MIPNGCKGSRGGFHALLFFILAKITLQVRNPTLIYGRIRELGRDKRRFEVRDEENPGIREVTEYQRTP